MDITIVIILSVVVWLILGYLSYNLRKEKGYNGGFIVGVFFGIFALIYNAGLPDLIVRQKFYEIEKTIRETKPIKHKKIDTKQIITPTNNIEKERNDKEVCHIWRCASCGEMISQEPCPKCGYISE